MAAGQSIYFERRYRFIETADKDTLETFYVNNALPFGRAGYLSVARTAEPGIYEVIAYDRSGNGGDGKVVHYRL